MLNLRLRDFGLIRIAQRFFDLLNTQIFLLLRHNFLRLKGLLQRFGLQRDVIFQVNFQFLSDLFIHLLDIFRQPTLPVRRDSPKTAITLVLAVLLGGMIGAGIVLGRNALRSYKPKAL